MTPPLSHVHSLSFTLSPSLPLSLFSLPSLFLSLSLCVVVREVSDLSGVGCQILQVDGDAEALSGVWIVTYGWAVGEGITLSAKLSAC